MQALVDYFYRCGREDVKQNVQKANRNIVDIYSLYYQLGVLTERFQNCPTKLQLLEELKEEFSQYYVLPNSLKLSLKNHYSHRLLKKMLNTISYYTLSKKPICSGFSVSRIKR